MAWAREPTLAAPQAALPAQPEIATGFSPKPLVRGERWMVVAAHPLAAEAGRAMLRAGGSAVDAAIAAQLVLGIVEPQSSGLGGGAFALHLAGPGRALTAWDGRETAPTASRPDDLRWIDADDRRPPQPGARASGRSIGVPGLARLLEALHREGGRLPWATLFEPALRIAEEGFAVTPRLHASLRANAAELRRDREARALWFDAAGEPLTVGHRLRWPAMAALLKALARDGADALHLGPLAEQIVARVQDTADGRTPGRLTLADLAAYRPIRRAAVCGPYRGWEVCGMPPPSSGGIAVLQVLGLLEGHDLAAMAPVDGLPRVDAVHLLTDALRLAFADRERWVADADFAPLPGGSPAALLDRAYLRQRAALIDPARSLGTAAAGEPPGADRRSGIAPPQPEAGTTQITVVDGEGAVLSLTSSIESAFGAWAMTAGGLLLNNHLNDFSARRHDDQGRPVANRLEPAKRPRSSMAPTLVFERNADGSRGAWLLATGTPGGATIIPVVAKTLLALLDWRLDAQAATALPHVVAFNSPVTAFGAEHPAVTALGDEVPLFEGLRHRGHALRRVPVPSGLATIVQRRDGEGRRWFEGAADPRREGVALAD